MELNSIQGWPNFFLGGPSGKASPKTVRLGSLDCNNKSEMEKAPHPNFFTYLNPLAPGAGVLHPPVCGEWPGLYGLPAPGLQLALVPCCPSELGSPFEQVYDNHQITHSLTARQAEKTD